MHHDIWEHDVSTGPVLYDTTVGGRPRKGIAVARTDGYFFLLDRETGKPLLPIEERAVKQDAQMATSPTQPFPVNADRVGPGCAQREQMPEGWTTGCYFDPIRPDMANVFMPHMNLRQAPVAFEVGTGYLYAAACVRPKWIRRPENPWIFITPSRVPGVGQMAGCLRPSTRARTRSRGSSAPHAQCAGSGATATAGGLMLHNEPDGGFQVFNARTGAMLWQFETGETRCQGPMARLAVQSRYTKPTASSTAPSRNHHVWAFKLGGTIPPPPPPPLPVVDDWDGRIEDATTIAWHRDGQQHPKRESRRAWSNPWAVSPARVRVKAVPRSRLLTKVAHTIKARDGSWTSGSIAPGSSASVTVARPSMRGCVCSDHPWSIGQLIVQ